MKKYCLLLSFFLIALFSVSAVDYTVETIPNVHVADKTQYVSNPDGILSAQAVSYINSSIDQIWQKTTSEVVVVAVNSIGNAEINDFATDLFGHWGIGKKDKSNGVLILLVEGQHKAVIRTGYGAEGLLPDIICGRIIRDVMIPYFKKGDYDRGMMAAVNSVNQIMTTPGATEELMSKYANNAPQMQDLGNLGDMYFKLASWVAIIMTIVVLMTIFRQRKRDSFEKYHSIKQLQLPALIVAFITLGMGIPALLIILLMQRRYRSKRRVCPNCHAKMHKLSEEEDNKYLTPAQDLEEKLNSVDYDVWVCDKCGEVDVFPFINKNTPYQECPVCHAKAMLLSSDRLILAATASREGKGVKTYTCRNCHNKTNLTYIVPKDETPVIVPIIGGFGGRGGGGFGGGSFGGGMTGGGGASGGW